MKYQTRSTSVVRGLEARTITKWTSEGWELVSENKGMLQTTLTFRRPRPPLPVRTIALFAAAATVMAVVIGILAVLEKKGDPQQPTEVAQASQAAEAASTPVSKSPSEAPTEEPTQTPTLSTTPDDTDILTVADNTDLATLLENAYECDPFPADFAKRYEGRNIEFDGYVADIAPHNSYKTRFDILIYAGTPESITGPSFQFRDVNLTYDIKQRGDYLPDNVVLGQRIHLVAKVDRFEQQSCLFLLEPVATTFLQ